MGMKKRITSNRRVISRVDRSLTGLDIKTIRDYALSLDIESLGDISQLIEPPTIWTISPLKAKYAHLDMGEGQNNSQSFWNIFALHVVGCEDRDVVLEWEGAGDSKSLTDAVREQIPEDYIRDIAQMIIQLANGDGTYVPFDVQAGYSAIMSAHRVKAKVQRPPAIAASSAPSEDAKTNDSE
jgi:hypothetical protein